MASVKFRHMAGMMLLANGKMFGSLPFTGTETTNGSFSVSEFYPSLWSRELTSNPAGGKGLMLWRMIKSFAVEMEYAVTPDVGSPFVVAGTGIVTRSFFGDERDTLTDEAAGRIWTGGFTVGTQQAVMEMQLYSVQTPPLSGNFPPTPYYITPDSIAPSFWIAVTAIAESAASFSQGSIRSYDVSGFSINGNGNLLDATIDLRTEDHSPSFPYTVTGVSLAITGLEFYEYDGTYDTTTGLYLPGVTTNRYED